MSGFYLRGAFVEFMPTFLGSLPNFIMFQYNPETITHTWKIDKEAEPEEAGRARPNPLSVKGRPEESFSFKLAVDASDMVADGSVVAQGIALATGVYTRIAALEMLMQPVPAPGDAAGLVGTVSAAAGGATASVAGAAAAGVASGVAGLAAGTKVPVPGLQVPAVLFVWGPGRVVPVRVTSLRVTEMLFDTLLNPSHAEVTVELDVLSPDDVSHLTGPLKKVAEIASAYSEGLRQTLAVANLANTAESLIGLLPF